MGLRRRGCGFGQDHPNGVWMRGCGFGQDHPMGVWIARVACERSKRVWIARVACGSLETRVDRSKRVRMHSP